MIVALGWAIVAFLVSCVALAGICDEGDEQPTTGIILFSTLIAIATFCFTWK